MNRWLFTAGLLSWGTAALHAFGGGPEINDIVQASDLPLLIRSVSAVIWHAITLILILNGAVFVYASINHRIRSAAWLSVAQYLAFAVLFVFFNLKHFDSLMNMPQWILFVTLAGLAAIGCLSGEDGQFRIKRV